MPASRSSWRTPVSAWARGGCSACSSASTAAATAGPRRRGPASGCRSSSRWWTCMAARSTSRASPASGTTFRVLLPAARATADAPATLGAIRGRRVLVVDDERRDRGADRRPARRRWTSVRRLAADGEKALALLRSEHFDALTLDILMPGIGGFEVLGEIRARTAPARHPDRVRLGLRRAPRARRRVGGRPSRSTPTSCGSVLAAAVRAGRSRVLVVGRERAALGAGAGAATSSGSSTTGS